jgi:2-dehydro-3-deoxygluconokinase
MTQRKTILCLGEILLRLTPPGQELLLQSPALRATIAGAEANVATALAGFGQNARMLSVLPKHPIASAARAQLRGHGVDVSLVAEAPGRMGLFYLTPGAVRRASEVDYDRKGSAFAVHPELADPAPALAGAHWFHMSGITPALGRNCADFAISATRKARAAGLQVSFDGNYRSKLWEGWESEAPAILHAVLEQATVLFGDDRDLGLILGKSYDGAIHADRRMRAVEDAFKVFPHLTTIACTTRASSSATDQSYGADLFTRTEHVRVEPVDLTGIVDRLGTGDAFAAGIIHGLLTSTPLQKTLAFAHAAACLKHSVPGDFLSMDAAAVTAAISSGSLDVRR